MRAPWFISSAKSRIQYKKKMAVGSAGRQRDGDTRKRKATAVSDDVMVQKRLFKDSVSNVFRRSLGGLSEPILCVCEMYICSMETYVLAEPPVLKYCCYIASSAASASSFFISLCSAVVMAPPATLCLCCSWWPWECRDGLCSSPRGSLMPAWPWDW